MKKEKEEGKGKEDMWKGYLKEILFEGREKREDIDVCVYVWNYWILFIVLFWEVK